MEQKENGFSYTYNAAQQQEIETIRNKYTPRQETPLERLRKLDNMATQKAQAASIAMGVIGALVMGSGMSLLMTDLHQKLALGVGQAMVIGLLAGFVGIVLVALAYPIYNRVLKKERERIAPEILRLSDELLK